MYKASCAKMIEGPQILDQSGEDMVSGPDQLDNKTRDRIAALFQSVTSQKVSAQVKFDIMQSAVETCPKVNMGCGRKRIPSLLDSGSQVTLICQSYFERKILPHIVPSRGEKVEAHQLFKLTAANNGKSPMSMYIKLNLDFSQAVRQYNHQYYWTAAAI